MLDFNISKMMGKNKSRFSWFIAAILLFSFGHQSLSAEGCGDCDGRENNGLLIKVTFREEGKDIKSNLSRANAASIQLITSVAEEKKHITFQLLKDNESKELIIGYLSCYLIKGKPDHIVQSKNPIIIEQHSPKSAFLQHIEIYEEYRGKGYGKAALLAFHDLLDKGEVDFTILVLQSKISHAGIIYKNQGYMFTPNTLKLINRWAQQRGISPDEGEMKFLADTTQSLPMLTEPTQSERTLATLMQEARISMPTMVRFNPRRKIQRPQDKIVSVAVQQDEEVKRS